MMAPRQPQDVRDYASAEPSGYDAELAPWKRYVTLLCTEAWELGAADTAEVLRKIEALVVGRVLTEPAVAMILERAGVTVAEAGQIAPSIRVAITA